MEDVRRDPDRELHTEDLAANAGRVERERRTEPREYEEPLPERGREPLFAADETEGFRTEWANIQIAFVDEPRNAVERADALVARVMTRLAEVFADERGALERQWARGDRISTEDLRIALRRYRSFFDRLLTA
jgi:hypothetical protein